MMSIVILLFFLCSRVVGESCTEGFIDSSLLAVKAQQIPNTQGSLSNNTLAESQETRWILDYTFNCTGQLTEVILGVDIRSVTGNRMQYPRIEIWRRFVNTNSFCFRYTLQHSVPVVLTPDNFTTTGIYRFTFTTPLNVTNDSFLGWYQPPSDSSVVRLFKVPGFKLVRKIKSSSINENVITFDGNNQEYTLNSFDTLIHPITEPSNCFNGFLNESTVRTGASSITNITAVTNDSRAFPDIRITCNGIITSWIVGTAATLSHFPLIQLRNSTMLYTALAINTNSAAATQVSTNVYNFSLADSPIEVKAGDILVVTSSSSPLYYQQFNGPPNYQITGNNDLTLLNDANDYPLISAVVVSTVASSSIAITSSPIADTSSPIADTSSLIASTSSPIASTSSPIASTSSSTASTSSSIADTSSPSTDTSSPIADASSSIAIASSSSLTSLSSDKSAATVNTLSSDVTSSPSPDVSSSGNNTIPITAAVISIIVILIVVTISLAVSFLLIRKRRVQKTLKRSCDSDADLKRGILKTTVNTIYDEIEPPVSLDYTEPVDHVHNSGNASIHNPLYTETAFNCDKQAAAYETPFPVDQVKHQLLAGTISNPMYTGQQEILRGVEEAYATLESSLYVPTIDERVNINTSARMNTLNHQTIGSLPKSEDFFTEEPRYWRPGSDTSSIYQQLSTRRFREISRHEIQILKELGSGEFGAVFKGSWQSMLVAIKTLKDNTLEEERVKFLQEAAIMGQFHHPNIVKLHGVVTLGEPAMIVLELMAGGDLREYLQMFRPTPGELVLSTLPGHLLSFCRQIASGMKYLAKKSFVHRDLAARNILVTEQAVCKIADFGMSRDLQDENYYISNAKKIPIKWTAPEALHFKRYSTASDVWSYGAVLYEIWSLGHKPFESHSNQQCMGLIESGYRLPPPPGCPRAIYEMMIQCWHPETVRRPTFVNLVSRLSLSDVELLKVSSDQGSSSVLGGPLETGYKLYTDLQNIYI